MTAISPGLTEERLAELRSELRGAAVTPDEPGYAERRLPFNAMHPDRPDVVVRPGGTADVMAAVRFARAHDLEITVRGGGHSVRTASPPLGASSPRQASPG